MTTSSENLKDNQTVEEELKYRVYSDEELREAWPTMTQDERDLVCRYNPFTIEFCRQFKKEINWVNFSINPNITFGHLDKFPDLISWKSICLSNSNLSDSFLYNYRLKVQWDVVLCKQQLDLRLLVFLAEEFRKSSNMEKKNAFFKAVSRYQEMDITFIKAFKRYIDMKELSKNVHVDWITLTAFIEELDPEELLKRDLPKEFFQKNAKFFKNTMAVRNKLAQTNS